MAFSIDHKGVNVWVFDNIPGRGYGTNWEYTRLPPELQGNSKTDDKPWTTTIGPYVLTTNKKEKVEMGGGSKRWLRYQEIKKSIDSEFPEHITKERWGGSFIIISHGVLPLDPKKKFFISEYVHSKKKDEFGRPGTTHVISLILDPQQYKATLEYIESHPPNVTRELFRKLAPGLAEKCTLPEERDKPIIITCDE